MRFQICPRIRGLDISGRIFSFPLSILDWYIFSPLFETMQLYARPASHGHGRTPDCYEFRETHVAQMKNSGERATQMFRYFAYGKLITWRCFSRWFLRLRNFVSRCFRNYHNILDSYKLIETRRLYSIKTKIWIIKVDPLSQLFTFITCTISNECEYIWLALISCSNSVGSCDVTAPLAFKYFCCFAFEWCSIFFTLWLNVDILLLGSYEFLFLRVYQRTQLSPRCCYIPRHDDVDDRKVPARARFSETRSVSLSVLISIFVSLLTCSPSLEAGFKSTPANSEVCQLPNATRRRARTYQLPSASIGNRSNSTLTRRSCNIFARINWAFFLRRIARTRIV